MESSKENALECLMHLTNIEEISYLTSCYIKDGSESNLNHLRAEAIDLAKTLSKQFYQAMDIYGRSMRDARIIAAMAFVSFANGDFEDCVRATCEAYANIHVANNRDPRVYDDGWLYFEKMIEEAIG
jgi:hypothetical protein